MYDGWTVRNDELLSYWRDLSRLGWNQRQVDDISAKLVSNYTDHEVVLLLGDPRKDRVGNLFALAKIVNELKVSR